MPVFSVVWAYFAPPLSVKNSCGRSAAGPRRSTLHLHFHPPTPVAWNKSKTAVAGGWVRFPSMAAGPTPGSSPIRLQKTRPMPHTAWNGQSSRLRKGQPTTAVYGPTCTSPRHGSIAVARRRVGGRVGLGPSGGGGLFSAGCCCRHTAHMAGKDVGVDRKVLAERCQQL